MKGDRMNINEKVEAARISVAAMGVTVWGVTLNEWVAIVTLIYLLVQIVILTPKVFTTIRHWLDVFKKGKKDDV